MKIVIDTVSNEIILDDNGDTKQIPLFSKDAFEIISRLWVQVGWNEKYQYTFSWLGRPIIQLPEDMIRLQEVIYRIKPDVILETGIAHGGSLIFSASLCKAINKGRVIGVDIEIRPHNRQAIESHELSPYITLIEGSSVDESTVQKVKDLIHPNETVLVILDSNHSKQHVLQELEIYSSFVSKDSYIVATDGIMEDLRSVPRGRHDWVTDNPSAAAKKFLEKNSDFILEQPEWVFNESDLDKNITHWPNAWLRRK
jgi:cephalosporin hydroxylase